VGAHQLAHRRQPRAVIEARDQLAQFIQDYISGCGSQCSCLDLSIAPSIRRKGALKAEYNLNSRCAIRPDFTKDRATTNIPAERALAYKNTN
jgi:hypothetical protein